MALTSAGALAGLVVAGYEFLAERRIGLAAWRGTKYGFCLAAAASTAYAFYVLSDLSRAVNVHRQPNVRDEVTEWTQGVILGFVLLLASLCATVLYLLFKFLSQRFAESRLTVIKDLLLRVERLLEGGDPKREQEAINLCLTNLLAMVHLSPYDWLLRWRRLWIWHRGCCRAVFYVPDGPNRFRAAGTCATAGVSSAVVKVSDWLNTNYFPVALDEAKFDAQKERSKGRNPKGWMKRYLNMADRGTWISAVGWVAAMHEGREVLHSSDASKCLAFDDSYMQHLRQRLDASQETGEALGWEEKDIRWVEVRSFIACPVKLPGGAPSRVGVLFVGKNMKNGFVDEDVEPIVAVAQVLRRVLREVGLSALTDPAAGKATGPLGIVTAAHSAPDDGATAAPTPVAAGPQPI